MNCLDERFIQHGDIKWFAAQPFQTAERRVRLNRK